MPSNVMIGMYCQELGRFSETYGSLWALDRPDETHFVHNFANSQARAQNEIAAKFLASDAEYLFLTNDDHNYPPDTLTRLLAHKLPIVSGLYLRRSLPFEPVMFAEQNERGYVRAQFLKRGVTGLIQVKACGGGCLLIHRSVLESTAAPWWELATIESDLVSEDVSFCQKVRAAGFDIHVDLNVKIGHLIVMTVWPSEEDGEWSTLLRQGQKAIAFEAATPMMAMQTGGK